MKNDWEIERLNWDSWKVRATQDALDMKNGKWPSVVHMPTELLTIEEIVERYGYALTDEQIQMLKDGTK